MEWERGERARAALFSTAVLGAVLWPLTQYRKPLKERADGFPLSWYPMFSARRPRKAHVNYAVGVAADGTRRPLDPRVLGSGGLNQVRRQLNRAVREGTGDAYAAAVAARVAARAADVVRVDVVRGRFDLDRCLRAGPGHYTEVTGRERVVGTAPVGAA